MSETGNRRCGGIDIHMEQNQPLLGHQIPPFSRALRFARSRSTGELQKILHSALWKNNSSRLFRRRYLNECRAHP